MDIEDSGNYRNDEEYELENLCVHHLLACSNILKYMRITV